jgi:hypothetical protein
MTKKHHRYHGKDHPQFSGVRIGGMGPYYSLMGANGYMTGATYQGHEAAETAAQEAAEQAAGGSEGASMDSGGGEAAGAGITGGDSA